MCVVFETNEASQFHAKFMCAANAKSEHSGILL